MGLDSWAALLPLALEVGMVFPFVVHRTRLGAEDVRFSPHIAPSLAYELITPLTLTSPAPEGSASSRYTFNGLSPEAWLAIIPGITR